MTKTIKEASAQLRADKAVFYASDDRRKNECARAKRRARLLSMLEDERIMSEADL
jgi:hypothetical protein